MKPQCIWTELLFETDYWQSIKRIYMEVLDYLQIFAKDYVSMTSAYGIAEGNRLQKWLLKIESTTKWKNKKKSPCQILWMENNILDPLIFPLQIQLMNFREFKTNCSQVISQIWPSALQEWWSVIEGDSPLHPLLQVCCID